MSVANQLAKKEWTWSLPDGAPPRLGTPSGRSALRKAGSVKTRSGEIEGGGSYMSPVTKWRSRRTRAGGTGERERERRRAPTGGTPSASRAASPPAEAAAGMKRSAASTAARNVERAAAA
eukprot:9236997-Alexandrium_andersonii.AAC.1